MRGGKNSFSKSARIGGMNIAFDDLIVYQPIDNVGSFALRGADDGGIKVTSLYISPPQRLATARS